MTPNPDPAPPARRPPRSSVPPPPSVTPAADTPALAGAVTGNDVRVELAGHVLPLAELRARPERYRTWFAAARRSPGFARCLCTRGGQRLVIRELTSFHLARWPDTADEHIPGCPFFSAASVHSGAGAHRDAIQVTANGTRIAVDVAFTSAIADPRADTPPDDYTLEDTPVAGLLDGARQNAATITLGGLVQWLWETAGLNVAPPPATDSAPPARRSWGDCWGRLVPVVAALRLTDQPAAQLLHVVAPYRPPTRTPEQGRGPEEGAGDEAGEQVARALAAARDARLTSFLRPLEHPETVAIRGGPRRGRARHLRHRRLVLGELKDLTASPHGHKLALRHFPRPLFLTTEQHTHLTGRFPAAFSERRGAAARRIVLALVEGTPHGYLRLVDATVLLVDGAGYVPAESSQELDMIAALAAAGRAFFKPLSYGGSGLHPDFVLTDSSPHTVVEVWGVTGREDYEARRARKQQTYRDAGTPLLGWDVRDPLPTIPPAPPADTAAMAPGALPAARADEQALDHQNLDGAPPPAPAAPILPVDPGAAAGRNPS